MTFAHLGVTDETQLPGGTVRQRLERLDVTTTDGARIAVHRELTGCAAVRIDLATGERVIVSLTSELAVRIGSHLAALGAAELEPEEPEEGQG